MSLTEKEVRKEIEEFEDYIGHHSVPYVRSDQQIVKMIKLLNELVPPKKKDDKKKDKPK